MTYKKNLTQIFIISHRKWNMERKFSVFFFVYRNYIFSVSICRTTSKQLTLQFRPCSTKIQGGYMGFYYELMLVTVWLLKVSVRRNPHWGLQDATIMHSRRTSLWVFIAILMLHETTFACFLSFNGFRESLKLQICLFH